MRKNRPARPILTFVLAWVVLSLIFPVFKILGYVLLSLIIAGTVWVIYKLISEKKKKEEPEKGKSKPAETAPQKKSYGPEIDPIIEEGNRALSEMGRLYMSIKDPEVRLKINELMRITDKITQDAIADPSDIPQIKRFMNYYLPTTIKLLNAYDRMSAQGIEGDNLDKSMKSINDMLDTAIEAYKKRLDSLFEDQALDIETEIDVMNQMLTREGLIGQSDFDTK